MSATKTQAQGAKKPLSRKQQLKKRGIDGIDFKCHINIPGAGFIENLHKSEITKDIVVLVDWELRLIVLSGTWKVKGKPNEWMRAIPFEQVSCWHYTDTVLIPT